jgi:membrane protease YdiL (CAAX protease family)
MSAWQEWLLVLGVWLVLALLLGVGTLALFRGRLPAPDALLPPGRPRRPAPWGGLEVLLLFLLFLIVWPGICWGLLERYLGPALEPDPWREALALLLALPLQLGSLVLVFRLRGFPLYRLGLHTCRWRTHLVLAYFVWLVLVPLTQTLQLGIEQLYFWDHGQPPPPHPLTRLVQGPTDVGRWLIFTLVALGEAPVAEELLFRGLLQSWMQKYRYGGTFLLMLALLFALRQLFLGETEDDRQIASNALPEVALFLALIGGGYFLCLSWLFRQRPARTSGTNLATPPTTPHTEQTPELLIFQPVEETPPADASPQPLPEKPLSENKYISPEKIQEIELAQAWPAVYGTAALWSAIHPWPTPFALFPLGLALGWLAYRTRSLLGPLAVHVGFNLVACLVTVLSAGLGG